MSSSNPGKQWITAALLISIAVFAVSLRAKGLNSVGEIAAVQDESDLTGDWSGESLCQDKNSSCHDEKVVYHISKSKTAGILTVSADKIVAGKAINMGDMDFKYDRQNRTLTNDSDRAIWKFIVNGHTMEGTLTILPGKKLFRRVTLRKDA